MMECPGDRALDSEIFTLNEDPFLQIPNTTWRELEERDFTVNLTGPGCPPQCRLTGLGWYEAVRVTDRVDGPQFKTQMSRLTAAMKDHVKGRRQDAYIDSHELASVAGVSEDFIFNAIESRLIDRHFNIAGAEWEHQWKSIRIPLEFGLRPLEFG